MRLLLLLFLFFSCLCFPALSREFREVRKLAVVAKLFTADDLGQLYVVTKNNLLIQFSSEGDSLTSFQQLRNGDIGSVDASNPLKILVYYPGYAKVVVLDRHLVQKAELDLRRLKIATSALVAAASDGNIWVYDRLNAQLLKIDDQLNRVLVGNDLRQELSLVLSPTYMLERNQKVFLSDSSKGVFLFDRYANYLQTLAIYGIGLFQVQEHQLIYRRRDTLFSWDWKRVVEIEIPLPNQAPGIMQAMLFPQMLCVLYSDCLIVYRPES